MLGGVLWPAEAIERSCQRAVREWIGRRELDELAELRCCLVPAADAEVRDAERLANRRLLGLATLRLLERDRRLARPAAAKVSKALLEKVVRLARLGRGRLVIVREAGH